MRKSILSSLALALGLSLALSACDVSALPYAAKVGDVTISTSQLQEVLSDTATNAELRCVQKGTVVDGAGAGDFASSFTAIRLGELVQLQLEAGLLSSLHLHVSAFAAATATSQLTGGFSSSSVGNCASSGQRFLDALPSSYREALIDLQADPVVIEAHLARVELSDPGVARYEQSHRSAMTVSCLSVIVVASKATAESLAKAIKAGASFASLAKLHSLDTSSAASGGVLGCVVPGDLQPPIGQVVAGLSTGQLASPVAFNGGYVLLRVTSQRGLAPLPDALQAILNSESSAETALLKRYSTTVGVEINPNYGTFRLGNTGAEINPPVGPSASLLVNPTAVTPLAGG